MKADSIARKTFKLGQDGEAFVEHFLCAQGFKILAKNFNTKLGEIDLVAAKNEIVCFIEVKTRSQKYFPISTVVTHSKQKKITKAAKFFVMQNQIENKVLRFDVATVIFRGNDAPQIEYLENAFYACN